MNPASHGVARRQALLSSLAAGAVLAIGMGFGRFAFTGLYPLMVHDGYLTVSSGTLSASANYAGYLLGALIVARMKPKDARALCLWAMAANVMGMAALAGLHDAWIIIAVRGLAGVFSAFSMVAASLWLLQHMGHTQGAPLLYSGVGVGIVISAELIALGHHAGLGSAAIWLLLAFSGGALALVSLPALRDRSRSESKPEPHSGNNATGGLGGNSAGNSADIPKAHAATSSDAFRLIAIYGLAGFGYIVTATYLPLLIKDALGSVDPLQVWAVFGLGAVPSCFFWHALRVRHGTRASLILNLSVQAAGVALPALSHTPVSYLASAFLVGGTFMGTVTIAMPAARRMAHATRFNILAGMTAAYGVGQIAGPLVANALYAGSRSFSGSLLAAAGALAVAALLCRAWNDPDA